MLGPGALPVARAQSCVVVPFSISGEPSTSSGIAFDYSVTCSPPQSDPDANVAYECIFALQLNDFAAANLARYEITDGDPADLAIPLTVAGPFVKRYPKSVATYHSSIKATFATGDVLTVAHDVAIRESPIGTPYYYTNANTFDDNITGLCVEFNTPFGTTTDYAYSWDFGDGTTTGNHEIGDGRFGGKTVYRAYERAGAYKATLKVTSRAGSNQTATYTQNVVVKASLPTALYQSARDAADSRKFTFDASTSFNNDGLAGWPAAATSRPNCITKVRDGITAYDWDFGDGAVGQGLQATHLYSRGGTYNVTLKVTNRLDYSRSLTLPVTVPNQAPVAAVNYDCSAGATCTFDGSASTDDKAVTSYRWTFYDGTTAVTTTPTVQKAHPGSGAYSVSLTVNDGSLDSAAAATKTFRVNVDPALPSLYYAKAPCRIYDSVTSTPMNPNESRTIVVAGNLHCHIPADATAVAINFSAVNPKGDGHLVLTAAGSSVQSSMNFTSVRGSRTNDASIRLNKGEITIRNSSNGVTDLTVDVTGYYAPASSGPGGLFYNPFDDMCRAFDSRSTPSLRVAGEYTAAVRMRGQCGIPADADALAINFTVPAAATNPPGVTGLAAIGPISIFPSTAGSAFSTRRDTVTTASVNAPWVPMRNGTLLTLGTTDGDDTAMEWYGGEPWADTAADVHGYFSATPRATSLQYYPITPCRAVGGVTLQSWVPQTVQIQGNCGVPRGARAVMANVIAAGLQSVTGTNVRAFPTGRPWYPVSGITAFLTGEFAVANGTVLTLSDDIEDLTIVSDGNSPIAIVDVYGYFAH
jgi:hypothetical protein